MARSTFHPAVHGWLVLDKPLGLTSTQALGRVRRLLGGNKAGHGGTLDPLATGILPLAFGEATKLIPYIMEGDKEYEFVVRWGETRTTDDAEGDVTARSEIRPTPPQIEEALSSFIGTIAQRPPSFSAIKVQGERAYDLARAGEHVELQAREVIIKTLKLLTVQDRDHAAFKVTSGKGMYVRSLARDLALKLGTYGYVSALRRTKVGPFNIENAVSITTLESLSNENARKSLLLPLKTALGPFPTLQLTENEAHILRLGQKILIRPQHSNLLGQSVVFAEQQGVPVALIEAIAGEFKVLRGFHF